MSKLFIFMAFVVFAPAAMAMVDGQKPVKVQWSELAADRDLFQDPLAKLNSEQLGDLALILRVIRLIEAKKISATGADAAEAAQIGRVLKQQGVDVGWLLVQREQIRDMRERQLQAHATMVAEKLEGKPVTLTGFVVPITANEKVATEFFLVPSISMCSHGSFPPSTQMVHVNFPAGIAIDDRSTALQVTGTIQQKSIRKTFAGLGSSSAADAEYVITPTAIEIVKPRKQSFAATAKSNRENQ
jgi:hypothetical protein